MCRGGRIAGRYRLDAIEQADADGALFVAVDEHTGRGVRIALQPSPPLAGSAFEHPGLLPALPLGRVGAWYAAVLDPGDKRPLLDVVAARGGRLGVQAAIEVAVDLLDAVGHLHARGRQHGAIAPDVVALSPDGRAVLVGPPSVARSLTPLAMALAAPERWGREAAGARADIYAVGVLLYALVTGTLPYGTGPQARVGHDAAQLPASSLLPPALLDVLKRATARQPSSRPASAEAFAASLRQVAERLPAAFVAPVADTLDPAPGRAVAPAVAPLPLLAAGAVALLFVGLAVLSVGLAGVVFAGVARAPPSAPPLRAAAALAPQPPPRDGSAPAAATPAQPAAVVPVPAEAALVEQRVPARFRFDSYEAQPEPGFGRFAAELAGGAGTVRLVGHTDSVGSDEANHLMGLGRAWSVSLLLIGGGLAEQRIELHSAGATRPIAANDTADGRARNRRVTVQRQPTLAELLDRPAPR